MFKGEAKKFEGLKAYKCETCGYYHVSKMNKR